ncbi:MAG: PEGA domain-containing protein, partial [Myxococcota bacterium]
MQSPVHRVAIAGVSRLSLVGVTLAGCLVGSGSVQAAPRYLGAVARGEISPSVAGVIDAALQAAAERTHQMGPGETPHRSPTPKTTSVRQLERMLADARGRHLEGDFRGAVDQTEEATRRFLASYAYEEDGRAWEVFTDLLLLQGLALSRLDDNRAADAALRRIATIRPSYVPDPGIAPPRFTSHFRQISRQLAGETVPLRIESSPEGARVLLDGQAIGKTPLDLPAVVPGLHHFSVRHGSAQT